MSGRDQLAMFRVVDEDERLLLAVARIKRKATREKGARGKKRKKGPR